MVVAISVIAAVLVPAAIAWACNPQANMHLSSTSVKPGGEITATGSFFVRSTALRVSIEPGGDSDVVTTNENGAFSITLQAPSEPGSYTVYAQRADGKYQRGLPARASFEVTGASTGGGGQPSGSFREPSVSRSPSGSETTAGATPAPRSTPTAPSTPPRSTAGTTPQQVVVATPAGQPAFAGSVTPAAQRSTSPSGTTTRPAESRQPSERTATADLWSGFGNGRNPSLIPGAADGIAADDGPGSAMTLGLALLGLGLLALLTGLAVAQARRRRTFAG